MQVMSEKDGTLLVDLSKPADEQIDGDQPVSMRDALVFLEYAWFKTVASTQLYPGG